MKVTIEGQQPTSKYPYLGKLFGDDLVVLFINEDTGTVVKESTNGVRPLGQYSRRWDERIFTPLQGRVILEN